jgi:hypothetical protein
VQSGMLCESSLASARHVPRARLLSASKPVHCYPLHLFLFHHGTLLERSDALGSQCSHLEHVDLSSSTV